MEQGKKYKLDLEDTIKIEGHKLYRIIALRPFSNVWEGDKGGYVEGENNLSHQGNCWVFGDARVFGNAEVYGEARIYGYARIFGDAKVSYNADVYGDAKACDDAEIKSNRDYIVFKNFWSSGRYFTWTRSNNKWSVGCFHGTGEELIRKAYDESQEKGREYERVVRYVESILADEERDKEPSKQQPTQ